LSFVIRHSSFVIRHSSFVIRHSSFVIRHLSFVIRHSSFVIRHIGPNGMGQVCKLANQIAVGLHNLSIGEALIFAMKAGAVPERVLQALQGGAANSWAFQVLAPKILKRDFSPGFMVKLQQRDLRLVLDAARKLHLPLPGTALTYQLYHLSYARDEGLDGTLT
jgi:3-hydroxyisobutyrate dehydrogenase